jgi:hypothetical protein
MPILTIVGVLLTGALAATACVAVVWWALFRDKARGRRRCPRCWHNLEHTPGLVCGECGYAARSERDLGRTRRRWGVAALGLLSVVALAVWTRLEVTQSGWEALAPSRVLVALAPLMEPPSAIDEGWRELTRRVWRRDLDSDSHAALAANLGSMRDEGGSVRSSPAELLRDVLRRSPTDLEVQPEGTPPGQAAIEAAEQLTWQAELAHWERLDAALAEVPLEFEATTPKQAPQGAPLTIFVRGHLWGRRAEWRARIVAAECVPEPAAGIATPLQPLTQDWVVWSAEAALRFDSVQPAALQLEGLPPGPQRIRLSLALETRRWDWQAADWGPWRPLPPREVIATVNASPNGPLRTTAVRNDELDRLVRQVFESPAVAWVTDERPIGVRYSPAEVGSSRGSPLLFGVVVELCERGEPRRRSRFWWRAGAGQGRGVGAIGWSIEAEDLPALRRLRESTEGWTMRLRGDLPTALRAFSANDSADAPIRWWNGEIEIPLEVERSGRPAPPRIWRVEPFQP